jgi:hypothetical protein
MAMSWRGSGVIGYGTLVAGFSPTFSKAAGVSSATVMAGAAVGLG